MIRSGSVKKLARGSEWRKWDFQVHTPASHLNNQFGSDWDIYVQCLFRAAIREDIAVICLTDYFTIDGYKKITQEYLTNQVKIESLFSVKTQLPKDSNLSSIFQK